MLAQQGRKVGELLQLTQDACAPDAHCEGCTCVKVCLLLLVVRLSGVTVVK